MLFGLKTKILKEINEAKDLAGLEAVYRKYLGRKGELNLILRSLKDLPETERREKGREANQLKIELSETFKQKNQNIFRKTAVRKKDWVDVSAPGIPRQLGNLHPITLVQRQIEEIFSSMGFEVAEGPEVETEYYNFDALNVPKDHPARDVWDTFWLAPASGFQQSANSKRLEYLLRTHTSPVQARYMENHEPPFRIIAPGRCYRHEATDASHEATFHQVEGLVVDEDINLANLKGVLEEFMKRYYGPDIRLRWQPSYFPFVEPGLELLMSCRVCKGKGCSTCGQSGWIEVIPCGLVHPNVFKAAGYMPDQWQGFAFGMGLDRLAMMKYRINDIRLFNSGDLRFLGQF